MNIKITTTLLFCLLHVATVIGQHKAVGTWITKDDETGEEKSLIEIYEENGKYYGKIIELLLPVPTTICGHCKGTKKDQPLIGLVVIEDMTQKGKHLSGGTIMDPKNGKVYKCKITPKGDDKLKLRGYIGIQALGRNQVWTRKG